VPERSGCINVGFVQKQQALQMHSALMENVHNKVDGFLTSDRRQRGRWFVLVAQQGKN
jgi:hypothetical protein